jgi:diaminopimelate epimerase
MRFTKMHGAGNDYLYVDGFAETVADPPALARALADRHTGVGSDGLIIIRPSQIGDVRMEMYNADGSRGRMCGNGLRCLVKYAFEHNLPPGTDWITRSRATDEADPLWRWLLEEVSADSAVVGIPGTPLRCVEMNVETDSGVRRAAILSEDRVAKTIWLDLGQPQLHPHRIPATLDGDRIIEYPLEAGSRSYPVTCVSVGSAHAVVFVDDLDDVDLAVAGPALERAPVFPDRINVHFARVATSRSVDVRTWERGSGPTQACGSGACAVCVAGVLTGRTDRTLDVRMPGGTLRAAWDPNDHLYLTGPATEVFSGDWPT